MLRCESGTVSVSLAVSSVTRICLRTNHTQAVLAWGSESSTRISWNYGYDFKFPPIDSRIMMLSSLQGSLSS